MAWGLLAEETPIDPWGREYVYLYPGVKKPKGFDLFSMGEDGKPNTEDDIW